MDFYASSGLLQRGSSRLFRYKFIERKMLEHVALTIDKPKKLTLKSLHGSWQSVDLIRCITTQNRQPNSNNNEIDLNNTPK